MDPLDASAAIHNLLLPLHRKWRGGGPAVAECFDQVGHTGTGDYARLVLRNRSLACAGDVTRYELIAADWSAAIVVAQAAGSALSVQVDVTGFNDGAQRFLARWLPDR
jgi:hypothetical protein